MAQSAVQICNMALARIGVSATMSSLTESSNEARMCSLFYEHCRDQALQTFPWKFARATVALQDIGTPPPGWAYRYRYPNDCLKALRLVYEDGNILNISTSLYGTTTTINAKIGYDVVEDTANAGRALVANESGLYLEYTKRVEDPTVFDPMFTSALAWLVASEIATPLSADPKYSQFAYQSYTGMINEAIANALNEGYEGREPDCELITGRN